MAVKDDATNSEVAIFGRILEAYPGELTSDAARYFLSLGFGDFDKARMHGLAVRNQDGALSPSEYDELQTYVKVGHLLAVLQSKARRFLKKKKCREDRMDAGIPSTGTRDLFS